MRGRLRLEQLTLRAIGRHSLKFATNKERRKKTDMGERMLKLTKRQRIICAAVLLTVVCLLVWLIIIVRRKPETAELVSAGAVTDVSIMDVMCEPSGITAMEDGSLLITDTYDKVIWRVKDGVSTVYAGGETVKDPYGQPMGGYNDAALEDSYFKSPWAISPFLDGYAVSDPDNDVVRYVDGVIVQTLNGSTAENLQMTDMGWVAFDHPTGLASDEDGNLYISDTLQGAIRRVTPEGDVTTYASGLTEPMGLCWKEGILYVAETGANRIVKVENGQVAAVAGNGAEGLKDGAADQAMFSIPKGVTADESGTVYVSDTGNSAVRRIRDGEVTTLLARDVDDLESFSPVSPIGLMLEGNRLYVCDDFSQKVFVISMD